MKANFRITIHAINFILLRISKRRRYYFLSKPKISRLKITTQALSAFQLHNVGTPATSEHIIQLHYDLEFDPSPQAISEPAIALLNPTTNGLRLSKRKVCNVTRGRVHLLMILIPG
jgi:hypothetical protein